MTAIDGFPVSAELVDFLKNWSSRLCNENGADSNADYLSQIQDYLSRQLGEANTDELKTLSELIQSAIYMKDQFKQLSKLLPEIERVQS